MTPEDRAQGMARGSFNGLHVGPSQRSDPRRVPSRRRPPMSALVAILAWLALSSSPGLTGLTGACRACPLPPLSAEIGP
eukprot:8145382-Pyramimonas_sp.AAC.1